MKYAVVGIAAIWALTAAGPHELRVPVDHTSLFVRDIGRGSPIIVLHGGPDFDHTYLLPDLDRLADKYRLVYYDQRGRGRSADGVKPEDVSLASDVDDVDRVRRHFGWRSATILGHSWGGLLALEYALRYPGAISHLILMNPAPVSAADYARFRQVYREVQSEALDRLRAIAATDAFKGGDPDAVVAYYRIHFAPAFQRPEYLDRLMTNMRPSFTPDGVLKARAIEDRLDNDTWLSSGGYDLLPKLAALRIPTLIIYGDHDFIPKDTVEHIAQAIPGARMVSLERCGHFPYIECAETTHRHIDDFFTNRR